MPNKPTLHTSRVHHTTFRKLPIRGNFSFDPATPYKAFGQGLYVKTGTKTFAPVQPAQSPAWLGDPVTNTGKTKFYAQPILTIDTVMRRVIDPNPAFVHQEQDKVAW